MGMDAGRGSLTRLILVVTACVAPVPTTATLGQENQEGGGRQTTREPPGPPDIIVRGKRWGELRSDIERAEETVFARFNDINSTDDFDVHCRAEKVYGLRRRLCMSNSWRELSGRIGSEQARAMRGSANPALVQSYAAEAQRKQRLLREELRQLAAQDEQLREAMSDLMDAQIELLLRQGKTTVYRDVSAFLGEQAHGAKRVFEVVMGNQPWSHRLTQRTFTIANVFGEIRKLQLDCAEGSQRLDYEIGLDWTVPSSWRSCVLQVNAKRETTFRLFEF
jgi:hypothetical protein